MLSMDKYSSQITVSNIVKSPKTYKTNLKNFNKIKLHKICGKYPLIVKPNAKGCSISIFLLKNNNDLKKFLKTANRDIYLFQEYIKGREFSSGVVKVNGKYWNLPITEIKTKHDFFDYQAKDIPGEAIETTPAKVDEKISKNISDISKKIHNTLGLSTFSRSDFILNNDEILYYLETNSIPGMGKTSILPEQLKYIKKYENFIDILIDNATPPVLVQQKK